MLFMRPKAPRAAGRASLPTWYAATTTLAHNRTRPLDMLNVFFTVDVEVWTGGWQDMDAKFPLCFQQYVYGKTARGEFGLPFQLQLLNEHGLTGVFFVEPLFADRFGISPLTEIVGLISAYRQEIQLHLHTEWADEAITPIFPGIPYKRQFLRDFNAFEQRLLIAHGIGLTTRAGAKRPCAFRAGSFGFNRDTFGALVDNAVRFDSSYNASMSGMQSGVLSGIVASEPFECDGVFEFPMTVFRSGGPRLRHLQLTACSTPEIEYVLWRAVEEERKAVTILSHNFELLNEAKTRHDPVVVRRFERLCALLANHTDVFHVRGFDGLMPEVAGAQPSPIGVGWHLTAHRVLEQAWRRRLQ